MNYPFLHKVSYVKFFFVIVMTLISLIGIGQETKASNLSLSASGGINLGGNFTNNNFSYGSGTKYQLSLLRQVSSKVDIGVGLGLENLDRDFFYPLFVSFEGKLLRNENFKVLAKTGYSFAKNRPEGSAINGLELEGGFFMEIGRAWVFPVSSRINFNTSINLKYQLADVEYHTANSDYEVKADYVSFSISLGMILK